MFRSTMSPPQQHLQLIQAHQRELREEAERFAAATNRQDGATAGTRSRRCALAGVAARLRGVAAGWGI